MREFTVIHDLQSHQPVPEDGILTRQVVDEDSIRVVMFTFSAGQRLSEHTAGATAILHFISGEATVGLGDETLEARAGTWIRMNPGLRHSVVTRSPVVMLLTLIKKPGNKGA